MYFDVWSFLVVCGLVIILCFLVSFVILRGKINEHKQLADNRIALERKRTQNKSSDTSRNVLRGQLSEQFAPFLAPELSEYELSDYKALFMPVDYIIFKNMSKIRDGETPNEEIEIIFVDIKSGKAKLSPIQQKIKKCVENKRVSWRTITID